MKDFLNSNSSKNGNIVNKTKEFKSVYKNLSNIDVLKSTGSSGSRSGCVGSSFGQVQTVLVHVLLLGGMVLVLLEVEAIAVVVGILIKDCIKLSIELGTEILKQGTK